MFMSKKKKKEPYFPNNWEEISNAPAEYFDSLLFDQFMDWKMAGWQIPSSVNCIIRQHNVETGKVKEYVYQREHAARKKLTKMMAEGKYEFYVCNEDSIHHLYPQYIPEYDDPLA